MKISKNIITWGIGAILLIGSTFAITDRVYRNRISDINSNHIAQIVEINSARDSLKIHSDSVDRVLAVYEARIDSLEIIDGKHRVEIDKLKDDLKAALNDMWDHYLEDNGLYAYDYLQGRYLSKDTLEYLFSGEQVTYMATDIIRGDYLDSLLQIEQDRVLSLQNQVVNYKGIATILEGERDDFKFLTDELYEQLAVKIEELHMSEEEVAELKRKLRVRTAGGAGAIIGLVALLILL